MSLQEKLDELRQAAAERIPAELREVMHRAVEDLRASGIADRILKAGETAPAFELVDTTGQSVRSADLLARGGHYASLVTRDDSLTSNQSPADAA